MGIQWFIDGVIHKGKEPPVKLAERIKPALIRDLSATDVVTVESIMTNDLLTAEEHNLAQSALEALEDEDFHHLPVTDAKGLLVGIISDRDLFQDPTAKIGDLMTRDVLVCLPQTELQSVAQAMVEQRLHSIVVVDTSQRPIGIVTSYDILNYLVKHPAFQLRA